VLIWVTHTPKYLVSNSQCKKSTHPPVVPFLPSLSHSHGQATHRTSRTTSALCLPSASLWQPCLSALWQGRSPGGWRRWCIEKGDEGWWPSAAGGRTAGELDCDRSRRRDNGGPPSLQSPAAGLSHVEPASRILSPPARSLRRVPASLQRGSTSPRRRPLLRAHKSRNALRWENDAILHCTSLGMQNAFPVWVVCWKTILIPEVTVSNLFCLWVAIWVSCWSQPKDKNCAVAYAVTRMLQSC
jgi:hypothetical protein